MYLFIMFSFFNLTDLKIKKKTQQKLCTYTSVIIITITTGAVLLLDLPIDPTIQQNP